MAGTSPAMTDRKDCYILPMRFSLTTWNINSVRLRIDIVAKFLKSVRPDVLCLQETKCIDDAFPLKRFRRLGYEHVALNGQKGYHGVAVGWT
jgi:exodeoxyribonuclease-3